MVTTMIDEQHKDFLINRANTDKMRHSARSLFAHLCGTHALLEAWGNRKPVCDAGLFHSIYGTKHFKQRAWSLGDRATIAKLIGTHAELLAYVFANADRPKAWFVDMSHNVFAQNLLAQLREIEAANLIEQRSQSRWLHKLRESGISEGARQAIDEHLRRAAA